MEVGNPTLQLHNWAYGAFVQDDWRATRNLTVNFGLRYEFSSVLQEDHNLLGNFDPNSTSDWCRCKPALVRSAAFTIRITRTSHRVLALPGIRTAKGRTVFRGGGGLIYETVNWQSFIAFNNAFGPGSVPTAGDRAQAAPSRRAMSPPRIS